MLARGTAVCAIAVCIFSPRIAAAQKPAPGLILVVSSKFLNAGFAHPVEKPSVVNVRIGKYHVLGNAVLTGEMSYQPLPCDDGIRLRMLLSGTAVGCDTSLVRRIQVQTIDRSRVCVRQEVLISGDGVKASGQPVISAPTISEFRTATAGKPPLRDAFVRALARSQFRFMPARSNRIATQVSEIILRQQLEKDMPDTLARANQRFREQFLETLTGFEIPATNVSYSSTFDAVALRIVVPDTEPSAAPAIATADLALRGHEAVLNRLARQLYGGSTQIGKDLETDLGKAVQLLGGPPPRPPSNTPWSITFSKDRPIVFRFERDTMRVVMLGDEFELGKDQYKAMMIAVEYELRKTETGCRAVRHKLIEVTPPGLKAGEKPTPRQQVLRGFLATRLGQIFARELDLSRIALPEALGNAAAARVTRGAATNGWLIMELALP